MAYLTQQQVSSKSNFMGNEFMEYRNTKKKSKD